MTVYRPSETLIRQAHEQLTNLVYQGVSHFPTDSLSATIQNHHQVPNIAPAPTIISNCGRCGLSQTRKCVIHNKNVGNFKYFVLADYPDACEEQQPNASLFSHEQASSHLLSRLFERLGLLDTSFFSFAIKCHPAQTPPDDALRQCTFNLKIELQKADPTVLFCFGHRAFQSIALIANEQNNNLTHRELGFCGEYPILAKTRKVFVFPSPRELQLHPGWRAPVWQILQPFKV